MTAESNRDQTTGSARVADAPAGNWVDRYAPAAARPYLRLARVDRPIGAWLLLLPCWCGQTLAELSMGRSYPSLWLMVLFAIGAVAMRGAGCAYNDFVDRDFDLRVERTRSRPIPSGQVSPQQALMLVAGLSLVGLVVLVQLNGFTIALAIASLALVAIYPFMKRVTDWPQAVLGLAFNWGALVGWSAVTGSLALAPVLLYLGSILWTVGYDTIYAHQDKEDDALIGVRSTALKLGEATPRWLAGFYGGAVLLWGFAAVLSGGRGPVLVALAVAAVHLSWQIATLDVRDAGNCLRRFRSNREVGLILLAGIVAQMMLG
ncbi:MAG: 4-hydroxybenzoate octaprenyltransferase [Pseudomonadota bacterium]